VSPKPVVFHIVKWYPNRHDNLLGIFVQRHIHTVLPYTTPVVFYAMASAEVKGWYDAAAVEEEGVYTYRYYYRKQITGINRIDQWIKLMMYAVFAFKSYYTVKKKFGKPSLIHAHVLLRTALMARLIQLVEGVPYVLLEHASVFIREEVNAFPSRITRFIARYVVRKSKAVMTVSSCLAQGMQKRYGLHHPHYEVVYNGVDIHRFSEKENLRARVKKELIYVAEFDEVPKNTIGLLQTIASLTRKRTDFVVYMVGYGKDEALLHQTAEDLGVKNNTVFFTGKLTGDVLVDKIKSADALLLFSNFETLSCVVTEALCCGTPVISTAVGGVVEIVHERNGILVPKADQKAMEEALVLVLDHKIMWNTHDIAQHAQQLFSYDAVGRKMNRIYQKVLTC
jgi:glycosyltransferase involved in cell wall biosynthesis